MPTTRDHNARTGPRRGVILLIGVIVVVAMVALKNPFVLLLLATDGLLAGAILMAATLGGTALLPLFGLGRLPRVRQLLFGAGLGLGLLSLLVLLLGMAGLLQRPVWIAILIVSTVAGLARLGRQAVTHDDTNGDSGPGQWRWLWLLICPFCALAILVACVPPGYLWAEEGNGYDVLEYHLQLPREYADAGVIAYAPHNVYANFPANVEMLYLLTMVLHGDPIDAAIACKLLNAALAALFVAAAWMTGRRHSPRAGLLSAVLAAGVGWLTYLCGVAYVENAMLLFGLLSIAALIEAVQDNARPMRWCVLAGVLAGFSFGCKYPAGALVGLPLTVALAVALPGTLRRRARLVGVFVAAQFVIFLPWAGKNLALTGNPLFPLFNAVFEAYPGGWGPDQSERFTDSHAPPPSERGLPNRMSKLWHHVLADRFQRFGILILTLAAWTCLTRRRDAVVRACLVTLVVQLPVWLFATHLYARFAVPLLIPTIVLAGRVPLTDGRARRVIVALVVAGTVVNLGFVAKLYAAHMLPGGKRFALEGRTDYFTEGSGLGYEYLAVINRDLPLDASILLVGDAKPFYLRRHVDYTVVFNRNPLAERCRAGDSAADVVTWLANSGYTHLLVHWQEIKRLRRTYGFPAQITRELFARLEAHGLERTHAFGQVAGGLPAVELYRVPTTRRGPTDPP